MIYFKYLHDLVSLEIVEKAVFESLLSEILRDTLFPCFIETPSQECI